MKNTNAKLITFVLWFLFLMMMMIMMNLPHVLQVVDVGGSKYEDYGLVVSRTNYLFLPRKLRSLKPRDHYETKKRSTKRLALTDSTKEIDNLMRSDYPRRMKGKKRSPIHN